MSQGLGSLGMQQPFWQLTVIIAPTGCGQSTSAWQMPNEGSHAGGAPPLLPPQVSQHSPGSIPGVLPSGQRGMLGQ
jgi:hypothetical protein